MSATYKNLGIEFLYPENWSLSQSEDGQLPLAVALESPDGALWMLHVCPPQQSEAELLERLLAEYRDQYENFESSPAAEEIAGFHCHGIDAHFYCLDFLVTAQIRLVRTASHLIALVCQAENRQFDRQLLVFQAMLTSLLSHSERPEA